MYSVYSTNHFGTVKMSEEACAGLPTGVANEKKKKTKQKCKFGLRTV
jgi:hypothetical protein